MWSYSSSLNNEPLEQYNRTIAEKYWLINQFDIDRDVIGTIRRDDRWYVKEFRMPNLEDYQHSYYINEYGIVFEKISLGLTTRHNHKDKEVLLTMGNGKITKVDMFYTEDVRHYYTINFKKSGIHTQYRETTLSDI